MPFGLLAPVTNASFPSKTCFLLYWGKVFTIDHNISWAVIFRLKSARATWDCHRSAPKQAGQLPRSVMTLSPGSCRGGCARHVNIHYVRDARFQDERCAKHVSHVLLNRRHAFPEARQSQRCRLMASISAFMLLSRSRSTSRIRLYLLLPSDL